MYDYDDDTTDGALMDPECDGTPARCDCDGCVSEGRLPQTRDCAHWRECDAEAGRHGELCNCG